LVFSLSPHVTNRSAELINRHGGIARLLGDLKRAATQRGAADGSDAAIDIIGLRPGVNQAERVAQVQLTRTPLLDEPLIVVAREKGL
jgi:hypothetical protein